MQLCDVRNTAQQCRLGPFQDTDFAGDLEDSKSTSWGTLCILGSHTFVPVSWMCMEQTSVSHSSTESEINSLDVGLRKEKRLNYQANTPVSKGNLELSNVDFVSSNVKSSRPNAALYIFLKTTSCNQDAYQGKKCNDEIRVKNPQSCDWLVV